MGDQRSGSDVPHEICRTIVLSGGKPASITMSKWHWKVLDTIASRPSRTVSGLVERVDHFKEHLPLETAVALYVEAYFRRYSEI